MAGHWAIVVGVSEYLSMEPLPYAKRDAQALQDFLVQHMKFDRVFHFADDSAEATLDEGITISTQPTFANLKHFFQMRFAVPFLEPDDTLWFFFSGHGLNYGNQDYLLPSDADPEQAETTAIAIDDIVECLKCSGSNNIVLLMDACHTEKQKFGQGFGTDPTGVVAFFASDYNQTAAQIPSVGMGVFTYGLIEGLRALTDFRNATLEHLHLYLRDRLPKLTRQYSLPDQTPRLHVEAPQAIETIPIPHANGDRGLFQRLFSQQRTKSAVKGATPLSPARPISISNLAMGTVGLIVLCVGVYYSVYQGDNSTKAQSAKATQPTPPKNQASTGQQSRTAAQPNLSSLDLDQNGLQRSPKAGRYYAEDPKFSTSRREIGKNGSRFCIKKVDGGTTSATNKQVTVSSISLRPDGFYVDATQEKIRVGAVYTEFVDNSTTWQRLETDPDESGLLGECLGTTSRYVRQSKVD
jgi:Caspase domain